MLRPILNHKVPVKIIKVKLSKDVKHFSVWHLLTFGLIFAAIGGYIIWRTFAATTTVTSIQSTLATNIDYTSQSAVMSAYQSLWVPAQTQKPGWTGSVANCDPGTMSDTARHAEVNAINFARRLLQLAPISAGNANANANDMKTALLMEANGKLDHFPTQATFPNCWDQAGKTGGALAASQSLLSLGDSVVGKHVGGLLDDIGEPTLGHRLYLIEPEAVVFGVGTTGLAAAVQVVGVKTNNLNPHPDVMWPMKGYFPTTLAPTSDWSYTSHNNHISFKTATVSVTHNGAAVAVTKRNLGTMYYHSGATLAWTMPANYDLRGQYSVKISNIYNSYTKQYVSRTYTVNFFDPDPPTLKLVKKVYNYYGGIRTPHDWTLTASGTNGFSDSGDSTTFHKVEAGITYRLSESNIFGYKASSDGWLCVYQNGSQYENTITLRSGQNVTCTIINYDIAPTLTVVKNVVNSHGGTKLASDFTVKVNATVMTAGTLSNNNLIATYTYKTPTVGNSYTISEVSPTSMGYVQTSLVCADNDTHAVLSNPFIITPSQNVTCTITNSDQ